MELRPAGRSVCLPLLIFPCTVQSRGSLLAPAHPGGPGKRVVKRLWCVWCGVMLCSYLGCKSKSFAFAARYASNTWRSADLRVGALHQTKLYTVHTKFNCSWCSRKMHSLKRHNFAVVSPIIRCSEINWKHERKQRF